MKILVIGSGGREHSLVWKLRQSPRVTKIYCAPGNGGIADEAECVAVDVKSLDSMVALANQIQPDLTIVGPELPLMLGLVDEFTRRGWRTFGPTKAAAQLETSKSFAKEFLQRHHIPTAHYAICDSSEQVRAALSHFHTPIVVKADGLAAGKGVVIAKTKDEASTVANEMLSGRMLGEAGSRVVLEEFLQGDELSFLVVSDGERVAPLVAAQDHKRVGDGDNGPNTGGMGAYTTRTIVDNQIARTVDDRQGNVEGADDPYAGDARSRLRPLHLLLGSLPGRGVCAMKAERAQPLSIIGLGNVEKGDDGVGVMVVEGLREELEEGSWVPNRDGEVAIVPAGMTS